MGAYEFGGYLRSKERSHNLCIVNFGTLHSCLKENHSYVHVQNLLALIPSMFKKWPVSRNARSTDTV